ncbi:MAG TPA: CPBP family intramembrane glutamic endopeptidase [Gemmataceae bacterium]|jgi:membrane protease YdiL (CAAX protease family)|nr:CPBP family intramembrane glutamic endopeptidase [Gemmataceae bacterium]
MGPKAKRPWLQQFFLEPLEQTEEASRVFLASPASRGVDRKVIAILLLMAFSLTSQHFIGMQEGHRLVATFLQSIGQERAAANLVEFMNVGHNAQFHRLAWWTSWCAVNYFVLPALVIRLLFRQRLRDYGMKLHGALSGLPIYLAMLAIMGPLVAWMSRYERFQVTYPFYHLEPGQSLWPLFWSWELLYASQFVFLEFFFRGFILHGAKHRFGAYAILVMMVPYCMIHFTKPLPECLASIVAGLALGFMSLKTRSIWLGAALHISVALSMDFASLWRQGHWH